MPFKSRAQRRKFAELLVQGKISPETFEVWNRETGAKELPERVDKTASAKRKTKRKTKRKAKRKKKTARAAATRRKKKKKAAAKR